MGERITSSENGANTPAEAEAHKINEIATSYMKGDRYDRGNAALALQEELNKIRDQGGDTYANQIFTEAKRQDDANLYPLVSATTGTSQLGSYLNLRSTGLFDSSVLFADIEKDGTSNLRADAYKIILELHDKPGGANVTEAPKDSVQEAHKLNELASKYFDGNYHTRGNVARDFFGELKHIKEQGGRTYADAVIGEAKREVDAGLYPNVKAEIARKEDNQGIAIDYRQNSVWSSFARISLAITNDSKGMVRYGGDHRGTSFHFGDTLYDKKKE